MALAAACLTALATSYLVVVAFWFGNALVQQQSSEVKGWYVVKDGNTIQNRKRAKKEMFEAMFLLTRAINEYAGDQQWQSIGGASALTAAL